MSLLALPNELLLLTVGFLREDRDILALVRVSRRMYLLLVDHLYENNVKRQGSVGVLQAAASGQISAVQRFVQHDFDVHVIHSVMVTARKTHGSTGPGLWSHFGNALFHACEATAPAEVIELLLKAGVAVLNNEVPARSTQGYALPGRNVLVERAICDQNVALLRLLLEYGALLGAKMFAVPRPPLHVASFAGPVELVRLLLEHGADPNARGFCGRDTPLLCAVGRPRLRDDIVVPDGTIPATQDVKFTKTMRPDSAQRSVKAARAAQRASIIKLLLERGADPAAVDVQGLSPSVAPCFRRIIKAADGKDARKGKERVAKKTMRTRADAAQA